MSRFSNLFEKVIYHNPDNKTCLKCGKFYTYTCYNILWCNNCSVKYVQEKLCAWSKNERINNFIKEKQQKANRPEDFFEWIPINSFKGINLFEKNEYAKFYSAVWTDGCLEFYNEENNQHHRHGELIVILEELINS